MSCLRSSIITLNISANQHATQDVRTLQLTLTAPAWSLKSLQGSGSLPKFYSHSQADPFFVLNKDHMMQLNYIFCKSNGLKANSVSTPFCQVEKY